MRLNAVALGRLIRRPQVKVDRRFVADLADPIAADRDDTAGDRRADEIALEAISRALAGFSSSAIAWGESCDTSLGDVIRHVVEWTLEKGSASARTS